MRKFIGRNTIQALSTIFKKELHGKVSDKDEFTDVDTLRIYNSITGKDIPNLGSLVHDHDERYYQKNELYTKEEVKQEIIEKHKDFHKIVREQLNITAVPDVLSLIGIPEYHQCGNIVTITIRVERTNKSEFIAGRHYICALPEQFRPVITEFFVTPALKTYNTIFNRSVCGTIDKSGNIHIDIEDGRSFTDLFIVHTYMVNQ